MKLLRLSLVLAVVLVTVPTFAQNNRAFDLNVFATWVDPNSSGTFNSNTPNQPLDVEFNGDLGYGIGANIFFGDHLSAEFAASRVEPEARFRSRAVAINGTNDTVEMIPITGVLQWHFAPNGFIDPYVGAGAAYVLFSDLDSTNDLNGVGVNRIDFKDDAGLALNAGLSFRLSPRLALNVDGKYVPLKSNATATFITGPDSEAKVDINPVMFSAGLGFRF